MYGHRIVIDKCSLVIQPRKTDWGGLNMSSSSKSRFDDSSLSLSVFEWESELEESQISFPRFPIDVLIDFQRLRSI